MKTREIMLDTETTGLSVENGDRIIEIGCVEMINRVVTGNVFHRYINPLKKVSYSAYQIHGISNDFLKDKPLFEEIVDDFVKFIDGGTLVIHNARFDVKFINSEFSKLGIPHINLEDVVDTLKIAKSEFPGTKVNLDALCKRLKIDNSSRELHGALKDAILLSKVYVHLCGGRQASFDISEEDARDSEGLNRTVANNIIIRPTDSESIAYDALFKSIVMEN